MKYFICLGSNLGNRGENIALALMLIRKEGIKIIKVSSLYETQPVDYPDQPWFYNQLAEIETNLSPLRLLAIIKKIERKMGRKRTLPKRPRLIDIDIILAEETIIRTEELVIPHPLMERRSFVLLPLVEISPETVHPLLHENIKVLWEKSNDRSIVRKVREKKNAVKHQWERSVLKGHLF